MTPVIPASDIITKINSLGKEPDRPVDPVAVAEDRLGDPPPSQAVVERCKCQPKTFLVRKRELDVLDYEDPEGGRREAAGYRAVHMGTDIDGACEEMALWVVGGCVGLMVGEEVSGVSYHCVMGLFNVGAESVSKGLRTYRRFVRRSAGSRSN
jgi:hypothetical protein